MKSAIALSLLSFASIASAMSPAIEFTQFLKCKSGTRLIEFNYTPAFQSVHLAISSRKTIFNRWTPRNAADLDAAGSNTDGSYAMMTVDAETYFARAALTLSSNPFTSAKGHTLILSYHIVDSELNWKGSMKCKVLLSSQELTTIAADVKFKKWGTSHE